MLKPLTTRQQIILRELQVMSCTGDFLADVVGRAINRLDVPVASIRRDIQAVRRAGHNIVYTNGKFALDAIPARLLAE